MPYFLFTGALVKKIFINTEAEQAAFPDIEMICLPEMGIQTQLLELAREREIETHLGQVNMNCESCKFRLVAKAQGHDHGHGHDHHAHGHHHGHSHDQTHDHHAHGHHGHDHPAEDPYAEPEAYHNRIWQVP